MHRSSPFSLSRLRSNRRLWLVCVLTMLFKLISGTVCLADGSHSSPSQSAPTDVAVSLDAVDGDGDGDCVLGEAGGCHCVCAHSVPVPPPIAVIAHVVPIATDWPALSSPYTPTHVGALLRPPIA